MNITQTFAVKRPIAEVWDIFGDVPFVASCLPGATLSRSLGDDRFGGQIVVKVGPIKAHFSGEVAHKRNASTFSGTLSGKGTDGRTASSAKAEAIYRLTAIDNGEATKIDLAAQVFLTGLLAQFGKASVIKEISSRLTAEFADNLNKRLCEDSNGRTNSSGRAAVNLDIGRLLLGSSWIALRRLFAKCRKVVTGRGDKPRSNGVLT